MTNSFVNLFDAVKKAEPVMSMRWIAPFTASITKVTYGKKKGTLQFYTDLPSPKSPDEIFTLIDESGRLISIKYTSPSEKGYVVEITNLPNKGQDFDDKFYVGKKVTVQKEYTALKEEDLLEAYYAKLQTLKFSLMRSLSGEMGDVSQSDTKALQELAEVAASSSDEELAAALGNNLSLAESMASQQTIIRQIVECHFMIDDGLLAYAPSSAVSQLYGALQEAINGVEDQEEKTGKTEPEKSLGND